MLLMCLLLVLLAIQGRATLLDHNTQALHLVCIHLILYHLHTQRDAHQQFHLFISHFHGIRRCSKKKREKEACTINSEHTLNLHSYTTLHYAKFFILKYLAYDESEFYLSERSLHILFSSWKRDVNNDMSSPISAEPRTSMSKTSHSYPYQSVDP